MYVYTLTGTGIASIASTFEVRGRIPAADNRWPLKSTYGTSMTHLFLRTVALYSSCSTIVRPIIRISSMMLHSLRGRRGSWKRRGGTPMNRRPIRMKTCGNVIRLRVWRTTSNKYASLPLVAAGGFPRVGLPLRSQQWRPQNFSTAGAQLGPKNFSWGTFFTCKNYAFLTSI